MKAFRAFIAKIQIGFKKFQKFLSLRGKKVTVYVDRNPNKSFYIAIGLLLVLIVISNFLGTPKVATKKEAEVAKEVQLYAIGTAPRMRVLAQVEKSNVITISAQAPGVVSYINASVGATVGRGQNLLGLSSNYQGGNASSLGRQLAETQYKHAQDTQQIQKDIIGSQRELAQKADTNADQMRAITYASIESTQGLVNLNTEIITGLDASIANLVSTNVGGANDSLILSTKELKSQFLAGLNGAKQGLALAQLTSPDGTTAATLSDLGRDTATRSLDLQEKMIALGLEISRIQLQIAQVVEGMMYPVSPFGGTIERIFVHVGDAINPGMPLVEISGDATNKPTIAIAYVSGDVAQAVSKTEESTIHINTTTTFMARPMYVSTQAVSGSLYAVYFAVPAEFANNVPDNGFVQVDLPIGYMGTTAVAPYIPIDSVYQTKDASYVYVERNGKAESITLELGNVYGSYVEVKKGLSANDKVIINRNVIAGDKVVGAAK